MTIIFDGPPDERPIMERLARMVAHLSHDSWKSAHVILQDALTKPEKPDGLREAFDSMTVGVEFGFKCAEKGLNLEATLAKLHDAQSARRNAAANKPAFQHGRIGSKGGI